MITALFCEDDNEIEIGRIENYDFENDIPEFEDIYEATYWVYDNSEYKSDLELYRIIDYLDLPEEFYNNKNKNGKMQGDCDGYSGFLTYLLKIKLQIESKTVRVFNKETNKYHIIIYCPEKNIFLDATKKNCSMKLDEVYEKYDIIWYCPYKEYLWMAKNYHNYVGKYK